MNPLLSTSAIPVDINPLALSEFFDPFSSTDEAIKAGDNETASLRILSFLGSINGNTSLETCQSCYFYLLKLLPHFSEESFHLLANHLPFFLSTSSEMAKEQKSLAKAIAHWIIDHRLGSTSLTKSSFLDICKDVMDYFSTAIMIANKLEEDTQDLHVAASHLFMLVIQKELLEDKSYQKECNG
jgi:hypothetical protein